MEILYHINKPDGLKVVCGLGQIIDGLIRVATLGMVSTLFGAKGSQRILRRDIANYKRREEI